jgi:glycosyltransferase involved in cell wall biosynthesis
MGLDGWQAFGMRSPIAGGREPGWVTGWVFVCIPEQAVAHSAPAFQLGRRLRVVMLLDWFFYYAAGVANGMCECADIQFVTRDHGLELGQDGDARAEKRELLDSRVRMEVLAGRNRSLRAAVLARPLLGRIESFRPDVLHVQPHSDWRLLAVQERLHAPVLFTIHDVKPHLGFEPHYRKWVVRIASRARDGADGYVVHGERLRDLVQEQSWYRAEKPLFVIPHGAIAAPQTTCRPLPERPTILFFGRAERYKGLDLFVRAAQAAHREVPELRAVIAARGPEVERCRQMTVGADIFDWREGFVVDRELSHLFGSASAVVLPYVEASQSGVIPLAFMNGRPVIVTDVGSLAEAVEDGQNALVVPVPESGAVSAAIVRLFSTPGLLEALSQGARVSMHEGYLSSSAVTNAHLDAYRTLLASRGHGGE